MSAIKKSFFDSFNIITNMILKYFPSKSILLATILVVIFLIGYAIGAKMSKHSALKDVIKIQEEHFLALNKANNANREIEKKLSAAANEMSQYRKEIDYANKQFDNVSYKLRNGYGLRVKTDNGDSGLPGNPKNTTGVDGEERAGFLEKSDESFLVSEAKRADEAVALLSQCQFVLFSFDGLLGEGAADVIN